MGKLVGIVVGAIPGVALGGVWMLALPAVGLALGYVFDAQTGFTDPDDPLLHDKQVSREEVDREARRTFARFLAALFVRVAEIDGEMTREEAATIRTFFAEYLAFDAEELELVRQAIQAARREPMPLELALAAAREGLNAHERSLLLYALGRMAGADDPMSAAERGLLEQIAWGLGLDRDVVQAMLADADARARPSADPEAPAHEGEPGLAEPFTVLGLAEAASDQEVKRAYRALAQKMHPDKVAHLGPQAVDLAARAFAQVNLAYEEIRKRRGL